MKKLAAVLVCVLMCACDEVADERSALAAEGDGGEPYDPEPTTDGSLQRVDSGALHGDAEAATDQDGGSDGGPAVEGDAAIAHVPRTNLVLKNVRDEVFTPLCVSCHDHTMQGSVQPFLNVEAGDLFARDTDSSALMGGCPGQYVDPRYEPDHSKLMLVFRPEYLPSYPTSCRHRPLEHEPTEAQIDTISDWIASGAK